MASFLTSKAEKRKSVIADYGLFARRKILKGETVIDFSRGFGKYISGMKASKLYHSGNDHMIQVADNEFFASTRPDETEDADFINHACDPNCGMRGKLAIIALRDIKPGEELTYDYAMTDHDPMYSMRCNCGSKKCRKIVTGLDWQRKDLQEKYRGFFSPYLQKKIDRNRFKIRGSRDKTTSRSSKSKKPVIKTIFFDLGGVVVDRTPSPIRTLEEAFRLPLPRLRVNGLSRRIRQLAKGRLGTLAFLRSAYPYPGFPRSQVSRFRKRWDTVYRRYARINRPVLVFAKKLAHFYRLGMISNILPDHMLINAHAGIFKSFRPCILSCRVHLVKPGRRIFLLALRRARITPEASVFVDDEQRNITGAKKLGMYAIRFKNVRQLKRDLKKLGVRW